MDNQRDVNDTMKVMEKYNFHKPLNVSIIYEDHEEEPMVYNAHKSEFVLINKVAEILASIRKALAHYCDVIIRCNDEKRKDRLKAHWLLVKHNLFNECLALSKEFLSQHGVTDEFIKSILFNIEQIAKVPITYNIVSNIHETLLKWIELKQFEMTKTLPDQSKNDRTLAQTLHPYPHFSSGYAINNMPTTNTIPPGPPGNQLTLGADPKTIVQRRNDWNIVNSTIPASSYTQESMPHYNYSFNGVNNQQITTPNASMRSSAMYYAEPQSNFPESVCYNGTEMDSHNTIITHTNQINSDDTARNSISRDSGFMSPGTSASTPEYNCGTIQHPLIRYEYHTSNFQMPFMTAIEPNMTNDCATRMKSTYPNTF